MNISTKLFSVFWILFNSCNSQSWNRVPKWTDVYIRGAKAFENLDFKLEFLMDNYDIISLEKCLHDGTNTHITEEFFVNVTTRMRTLRPESSAKVLFYWSVSQIFDCYAAVAELVARPDLWLRDDQGYPVMVGSLPLYDYRIDEAARVWRTVAKDTVLQGSGDGVFLDGVHLEHLASCRYKTCGEEGDSCCVFSSQSEEEYNKAKAGAVAALTKEMHDLDQGYLVMGNGLQNYDFNAGNGNPVFDLYHDKLDGFCMEHVMAFEGVNMHAEDPPFIKIPALENLIELRNHIVNQGLYLLVRSYPGPVGQPIESIGGMPTPHLPPHHPYPQPTNNLEVQQSMRDLLNFPLAIYLCAFADSRIYFAYSLWYSIHQSVPNPDAPDQSQFPENFSEFLEMNPGAPRGPPEWNGKICFRQFANFGITVNLEDENSGTWIP